MTIHPSALVDPAATVHPDADVGPFVVIEGPVAIGARTRVMAHATLLGSVRIGADNEIRMGAVIGNTIFGNPTDASTCRHR